MPRAPAPLTAPSEARLLAPLAFLLQPLVQRIDTSNKRGGALPKREHQTAMLALRLYRRLEEGEALYIHCRGGHGGKLSEQGVKLS